MTRVEEITAKLLQGLATEDERAELAAEYVPLALRAAKRFRNCDDYFGPALFGIAYAIEHPREGMDKWILSCISRCVRNFYLRNHTIYVPYSTIRDQRRKGVAIVRINVQTNSNVERVTRNTRYTDAILEALDDVSNDEIDRAIVKYRLEGFRDSEIGPKLQLSKSYVNARRNALEMRFNNRMRA
jgi:hypothetical protein